MILPILTTKIISENKRRKYSIHGLSVVRGTSVSWESKSSPCTLAHFMPHPNHFNEENESITYKTRKTKEFRERNAALFAILGR